MNIGIFDSGIGGVTLLHQAMVMMPHENFIFMLTRRMFPTVPKPENR